MHEAEAVCARRRSRGDPPMEQAFVIMQIGNEELDRSYERAIVPALRACGLEARRVDRHTRGGLLASEIIAFIESSDIIVADLTNERPNCYLEVGYALGAGRSSRVLLTAREDHNSDSPNHGPGGPKIHFDLAGYDILFWAPDDLEGFRDELVKRVTRRQQLEV
jgi:nucleoside 2-deoxyribosyltransferase